ncbi:MAG: hypothetical protein AUG44_09685 [Actinobacteria bacterium 13_1_20CM_3_71_11]|nr:MAG: hypothetical protein AUG44_09685 [Actinobacteria bacterium 13_1_20CM_3_71_11]TML33608.1 MAG: hypothetical protein E6G35_00330 [Actinomycetota bacterium]
MSPAARTATLTVGRSTRFVSWVRAWRAGLVPYDDVAAEIAEDEDHLAAGAPGTWTEVPLGEILSVFAPLHPDQVRLVLPVPGDPRGLPGPGDFSAAALLAEEAALAGPYGLVPEVRQHTSGSGDVFQTVLWRVYELPEERAEPGPGVGEAEGDLNAALAEATAQLARLDVAQWRPELAGALATLRRPDSVGDLPPGYDARARRLYARATVLDGVLALAGQSAPGGAVTGFEARQRDEALRPLLTACRRALAAAVNAPLI